VHLRAPVQRLFNEVESVKGKPVQVVRDVDLSVPATTRKSLPGQFSSMHLMSIMDAAFRCIAPDSDRGIDLSKEYEAAMVMRGRM
jgi:hypothetical protein